MSIISGPAAEVEAGESITAKTVGSERDKTSVTESPEHGLLTFGNDGTNTYTADEGCEGTNSFAYAAEVLKSAELTSEDQTFAKSMDVDEDCMIVGGSAKAEI